MTIEYPKNADGDALRRIEIGGSDMSKPMKIDFHIAAPDEAVAKKVATRASDLDYESSVYFFDETDGDEETDNTWTCECSRTMVPKYDAIIESQVELDGIAQPFGAYADGWGTFGNCTDE